MELIVVFAPLAAFLIAGLFGRQIGDKGAQFVTCAGVIAAAICSVLMFLDVVLDGNVRIITLSSWLNSGDLQTSWALRFDQLTVVMLCVITIVSACVHVYSIGYMVQDKAKARFMAYLSLFTFAMLMLVTADNLIQLFFGWEGVGLASYLLIGFWSHKETANKAAIKAFVMNRVGDFGLLLGIFATFVVFGTVQFEGIFEQAASMADVSFGFLGMQLHALTVICLLLFMGAVGKSAQLGLHTWLPDAMEGPTPVSALIHAATMVTAGVFLLARFSPVFEYAPVALQCVTILGACTAFVAATIGLTQFDIKRVIAFSTMSQLGYMFFAIGVSAYGAAIFHLMTHAFFKALLFLGAGSVIHAMSDEQDMRKMGGLWRKIPVTYVMMWIGSLALAGIPFFAGYYSKDIILEAAFADQSGVGMFAFWMGIAAALLTAFYSWRLILMTFHGAPRASKKVMEHVHESPAVMTVPLAVLAAGALFAGYVFYGGFVGTAQHEAGNAAHRVAHEMVMSADIEDGMTVDSGMATQQGQDGFAWNKDYFWGDSLFVLAENDTVKAAHNVPERVKMLPVIVAVLGILGAYIVYLWRVGVAARIAALFAPLHRLFFNKWYFDELYERFFVAKAWRLGRIFSEKGDREIIDRFGPDGISRLSARIGGALGRFQSGFVFQYAFVMIIGLFALVTWLMYRTTLGGY